MDRRSELINEIKRKQLIQSIQEKQNAPKDADVVNDSMPEWLNPNDRSVVKNLAGNDEESVAYLQKQYPDAEFKNSGDGIIARKKGEQSYGKLDPSFSPISNPLGTIKDLWNDTKDLGYDALQAGAETAGVAGGALAGLGAGSLPAAMAGGAVGAGAASTLKQMLRQKYGLSEGFDGGEVLSDAALGGVMPAAFKGAGKAIKYGAQNIAPSLYGKMAGKSPEFLKRLANTGKDISSKSSDEALSGIEALGDNFGDDVAKRQANIGAKYSALESEAGSVDVSPIVKSVDDHISELRRLYKENPSSGSFKGQLEDALKFRATEIGPTGYNPKNMKLEASQKLRNLLNDKYLPSYKDDVGQMVGKGVSGTEEKLANMVRTKLRDQSNLATDGMLGNINGEYSALNDMADFGRDYLGSPKKTLTTLKKIGEGTDDELLGRLQRLPKEMQDKLLDARNEKEVFDYLKGINKKQMITSDNMGSQLADTVGGKAPLEKLLGAAGLAGGYVSGGPLMGVAGGAVGRGIGKLLTSPQSVLRISRAAKAMNMSAEELVKKMKSNPWMMQSILGVSYAGKAE